MIFASEIIPLNHHKNALATAGAQRIRNEEGTENFTVNEHLNFIFAEDGIFLGNCRNAIILRQHFLNMNSDKNGAT